MIIDTRCRIKPHSEIHVKFLNGDLKYIDAVKNTLTVGTSCRMQIYI